MEKHGMFLKLISLAKNLITQLVSTSRCFYHRYTKSESPPYHKCIKKERKKKKISFFYNVGPQPVFGEENFCDFMNMLIVYHATGGLPTCLY